MRHCIHHSIHTKLNICSNFVILHIFQIKDTALGEVDAGGDAGFDDEDEDEGKNFVILYTYSSFQFMQVNYCLYQMVNSDIKVG